MQNYNLVHAASQLAEQIPSSRRTKLSFKDSVPGKGWIRGFRTWHAKQIQLGRASKQEEIRWRACNADTLSTHILVFEKLLKQHNIDASRICNLDETGVTPGKDVKGVTTKQSYVRPKRRQELREPMFRNVDRVLCSR